MQHPEQDRESIHGRWHLIDAGCADGQIPDHRVDLAFYDEPVGLRGAILSRVDGREVPLHSVTLQGSELRLRMQVASVHQGADSPSLVMRAVADHFEGGWNAPGVEHIRLKLVRARNVCGTAP